MNNEEIKCKMFKQIESEILSLADSRRKELICKEVKNALEKAEDLMRLDTDLVFEIVKKVVDNIFSADLIIESTIKGDTTIYKFSVEGDMILEMHVSKKKVDKEIDDMLKGLLKKVLEDISDN